MELDRKSTVRLRLRESEGSRTLQRQGDMQLMQNKLFLEQVESERERRSKPESCSAMECLSMSSDQDVGRDVCSFAVMRVQQVSCQTAADRCSPRQDTPHRTR